MSFHLEVDIYLETILVIGAGMVGGILSSIAATKILDKHAKNNNQKKRIAEINSIRDFIKKSYTELKNKDYSKYPKHIQPHIQNIHYRHMLELLKTFIQTRANHLKSDEMFDFLSILIAGITEHEERNKDSMRTRHFEILYPEFEKLKWLNYKHTQTDSGQSSLKSDALFLI